nr:TIGR02679 domain-containing protein [Bhargavaea cecembensis]
MSISAGWISTLAKGHTELLSLFAQKTTGNPHGFDGNQIDGRLLTHCLYVRSVTDGAEDTGMPRSSEDLNELYAAFGLARDDLWSFVTCRGLIGHTAAGVHPLWKAAADTGSVLNVPLKMLGGLTAITPAAGRDVWIVENSGVCSALVDLVPDVPVICTHGQFRTAAWVGSTCSPGKTSRSITPATSTRKACRWPSGCSTATPAKRNFGGWTAIPTGPPFPTKTSPPGSPNSTDSKTPP